VRASATRPNPLRPLASLTRIHPPRSAARRRRRDGRRRGVGAPGAAGHGRARA
jgi:hypothetical protein